MTSRSDDDDQHLTLRAPLSLVALAIAVLAHVVICFVLSKLPDPKKPPQRIELTLAPSPPSRPKTPSAAPPPATPRTAPKVKAKTPARPPPATSPVVPELPPSEDPPDNRAQLPVVEKSPEPAPPPPSTWKDRMLEQLAATRPKPPRMPSGVLAPTFANLDRVAFADPRLHDEENERRMMDDHGAFFRRGLEALRGHWHPDEVLNTTERDPARRCGGQTRTTYAVAVLDKKGNVVDVDLKTPSGCPALDDEAVAAFKRVAVFPHPPDGIFVAQDGTPLETARYPVRFIVTFDGGIRLDWR